jgi:hypothetical protein
MNEKHSYRRQIAQAVGYVYSSGIIPKQYGFTGTIDRVYGYCVDFVLLKQFPLDEYGRGEGNGIDWDEHLEAYVKVRADKDGWLY